MTTAVAARMEPRLPIGFAVEIRPDVRVLSQGRVLIGGTPTRAVRLSAHAMRMVSEGRVLVTDDGSSLLAERLLECDLAVPVFSGPLTVPACDVTVVIPVLDRPRQLQHLLTGLQARVECIVVDDGSLDPESIAAVTTRHGARLLRLPTNGGPSVARNAGLAGATTPFVAFVDSDVQVTADALLGLCRHFRDPRVTAVAPRVRGLVRPGTRPSWFQRYDEWSLSLDLGDSHALVRPGSRVSWLPSACLVVRRSAAECGFDESLRVAEDVDFVWRLVAAGGRVRYDPSCEVRHESRGRLTSWLGRKVFYGTGGALLAQRHGSAVAPAVMSPAYAVAAGALLAQRRWSAPVVLACTILTFGRVRRVLPDTEGKTLESARLAAQGLGAAGAQTMQLLLRHWWPATAVALPFSPRARRAFLAALVADALLTPQLHPHEVLTRWAARRLDDLAYGTGLWFGALRSRSPRALVPSIGLRSMYPRASTRLDPRQAQLPTADSR